MRTLILYFTGILVFTSACNFETGIDQNEFLKTSNDTMFFSLEDEINHAFQAVFFKKNNTKLLKIQSNLLVNKDPLSNYWSSYIDYLVSLYFLSQNQKDSSAVYIEKSIEKLKDKKLSSDGYALLGMSNVFSIQFQDGLKVIARSKKSDDYFSEALRLDSMNLRAYLGMAVKDYYTPGEYGGKKMVENYLKKAIDKPNRISNDLRLPSWGKDYAYELLIRYYLNKKDSANAKEFLQKAINEYPNNIQILKLSTQLL